MSSSRLTRALRSNNERSINSRERTLSPGSLRINLSSKNGRANQNSSEKLASGIQRPREHIKINENKLSRKLSRLPSAKLDRGRAMKLPLLVENQKMGAQRKKTVVIINNYETFRKAEIQVTMPKDVPQRSFEKIVNRRKNSITLMELRNATAENMIMPEDLFEMNEEAVSFSLSSRLRRKSAVVHLENSTGALNNRENSIIDQTMSNERLQQGSLPRGKKFKSILKTVHHINVVQEPTEEKVQSPDPISGGSSEVLSKNNDGAQTYLSANGKEDTLKKKPISATVKKPSSKNAFTGAPAGAYMGIKVHSNLMRPPFPFPTKHQILFGPYENPLLEVEDSLCIQHLLNNLDYYYMPTDPIRKSLLDPKMFKYAVEPIYNDQHIAAEALTILPIKIYS